MGSDLIFIYIQVGNIKYENFIVNEYFLINVQV